MARADQVVNPAGNSVVNSAGDSVVSSAGDRAKPQSRAGAGLGVLSIHFEGGRCRVNCPFCYLGKRTDGAGSLPQAIGASAGQVAQIAQVDLNVELVETALAALDYREVAVALSEPVEPVLPALRRLGQIARARGRQLTITTTVAVAMELARSAPEVLAAVQRINVSIDPFKGQLAAPALRLSGRVDPREVQAALVQLRAVSAAERVLIVTLSSERFAEQLLAPVAPRRQQDAAPIPETAPPSVTAADAGTTLLGQLLALPEVDRVALNALKPPPPWCDAAFWLRALHQIRPLLREHLDRRLFLDCYVAARILGIGGCPARPDLSPAAADAGSDGASGRAVAFRACVYQPAPDFVTHSADELSARLAGFVVPAVCPFPVR